MHIASKITLILGALIFVGSIAGVAIAGMALTDAGYKEEVYVDRSMSQTFTIQENSSWAVSIYVIHPADCDTLELSIVDSDGDRATSDWCTLDGGQGNEEYYPDGSEEFYGSLTHAIEGMEYTLESNVEVTIRGEYCDQACEEAIGGGLLAGAGGFFGFCCSVPLLVLGIILALVLAAMGLSLGQVDSLVSVALSLSLFSASFWPLFLTTLSKISSCRPGKCSLAKRSTKPRSKHKYQLTKTSSKDMGNRCNKWVHNNHRSHLH